MSAPFIILSLPRSRSTWLANFLSYGEKKCGHDIAVECSSIAEFKDRLSGLVGTAETGAVVGWKAIRHHLPDSKIVVVRRPVDEVYESLARLGAGSDALLQELHARDRMLDEVSKAPGVVSFGFDELSSLDGCATIFEHCLETPFDWEWWESYFAKNIQIDVAAQFQKLHANKDRIAALKDEARRFSVIPGVVVAAEPWSAIWPEVNELGIEHFEEVDGGVEPNRPFKLDANLMRSIYDSGAMLIVTARVDGVLVGYFTWTVTPDVESAGLVIAQQGAWFVRKAFSGLNLGPKMFDESVRLLRARGVKNIFPHHRMQGRGANLGVFFRRRGAKEIQHTYSLWIGD